MENTLEKASNLATEKLNKIEAPVKEKAAEEAKAASEAKAKTDAENKKIEGQKLADAEAQAQKDEEILVADEAKLSDEDKARKTELLDIKRKKDDTPEGKIERVKKESQKRIDEIKSELLEKENLSKQEIAKLKEELEAVKKAIQPKVEEDAKIKSKREESERISKYIEEDKHKTREDRREMPKDDLEAWYLEDPIEATAWVQERTLRRAEERQKKAEPNEDARKLADDFIAKQKASGEKLFAKYPGVNPSKETLAKYQGKSSSEINAALCAENEEFRICSEIVAANPKLLTLENGPELVMAEMDKRLAKPADKKVALTEEEIEAKIQAEVERRRSLDEGIPSIKRQVKVENNANKSDLRQKQEEIAKKAKISIADLDKTIERRKGIPGAGSYEKD